MKSLGIFRSGNFPKNRLEAFSDGVFAIVVTLLILEIRVPQVSGPDLSQHLIEGLIELLPKVFCYILSFLYITIYWVNHHQLFDTIRRADRGLFWLNNFFLMVMAFIPFPTALIGEYPSEHAAVMVYGAIMLLAALSYLLMKWYAVYIGRLTDPAMKEADILRRSVAQVIAGPTLYLIAIVLALFNTQAAIAIYVIIPIIYIFPIKFEG